MNAINLFSAIWRHEDSYGRLALELLRGLRALGVHVNCFGLDAPSIPIIPAMGGIYCSPASTFPNMAPEFAERGPKLGITMFEGTHTPPRWTPILNKCDRLVVPSAWQVELFSDNGVNCPIDVASLGISDVFKNPVKRRRSNVFTVYATGDSGMRKGWHLVGRAFVKVFGDSSSTKLLYKARTGNMAFSFQNPNVTVLRGEYSDRALRELYASAHCMVFPSAGEGFGFPPREFAATGGPVAATFWSGTKDHIANWGYPLLRYRLVRAWRNDVTYGDLGGRWAEADVDEIAEWLTNVYDKQDEYYDKAMDSARYVAETYRWDTFAQLVLKSWEASVKDYYARDDNSTHTFSSRSRRQLKSPNIFGRRD